MAINPYQSVLPGTEGNVYAPPVPKINPYQNVIPGTTGNTFPPPATTTLSATNIGATPIQLPKTPIPTAPTMPAPLAPTEGGVQLTQNADGTTSRAGAPTAPTPISVDQQATNFAQAQTPGETPAEAQQTQLQSRFTQLYEKLFGKPQAQQQAETAQGIPQKSQAVADIQSQINQLQNDANVAMIKAQTMGETSSFGNAQIAQIERDRTVKALQLNSFLFAAQGNLSTAQDMADRAVKAQFEPVELEINYLKEFLDMNEKNMDRADKKRAETLRLQLDERTRLLEEQKAERTAINSISIEAAQAGADALMLNKINSAKTQEEALQIAASDPKLLSWAKQMQEAKFEEEKRQFGMTYALARQKAGEDAGPTPSIITENLDAYAQRLASEGKLPTPAELKSAGLTVGQVSERAMTIPKAKGALVSTHTGVTPNNLSAAQVQGITAMAEIVNDTLPRLKELFPKLYTGILGGIGGAAYTTQNRQDYNTFKAEFLSKLLVARSGAAVTEQEYARYAKLLPGTFNQMLFLGSDGLKKLEALDKSMNVNLKNTLNTTQTAIYGYTPVKLGDKEYKVGDVITVGEVSGMILPNGKIAVQ